MVEQNYKGYVIFYPKTPMFSGSWTVYLDSNEPHLRARLRAAEVFTDHQNLNAAVAQAKQRVDELVKDDACAS